MFTSFFVCLLFGSIYPRSPACGNLFRSIATAGAFWGSENVFFVSPEAKELDDLLKYQLVTCQWNVI